MSVISSVESHDADGSDSECSYDPEVSESSEPNTSTQETYSGVCSELKTLFEESGSLADMMKSASNVSGRKDREDVLKKVTAWLEKSRNFCNMMQSVRTDLKNFTAT